MENKLASTWTFSSRVLKIAQRVLVELQYGGIGVTAHKTAVRSAICAGVAAICMCATDPERLTRRERTRTGMTAEIMWSY